MPDLLHPVINSSCRGEPYHRLIQLLVYPCQGFVHGLVCWQLLQQLLHLLILFQALLLLPLMWLLLHASRFRLA